MNLHICINDRFIELFIQQVALYDDLNNNRFLVYGEVEIPFSTSQYPNLTFVKNLTKEDETKEMIDECSSIYIHFLSDEVIDFLLQFELKDQKVIWVFWGTDGFSIKSIRTHYSIPFHSPKVYFSLFKEWILLNPNLKKERFIREKIDYFAHYIKEDFDQLKKLMKHNAKFINFSYGSCEKIVKEISITGESLIIGNSGDPSNYHERILSTVLPSNFSLNIHCPLSYGGNQDYNEKISAMGKKLFGNKFIAYTDILKPEDYYNHVLGDCSYAIMYQNRSQAWGNIMQLLYQGVKVFMHPDSNLFIYLLKQGFAVYPIKKRLYLKDFKPLNQGLRAKNKYLLLELFGQKQTTANYIHLLGLSNLVSLETHNH